MNLDREQLLDRSSFFKLLPPDDRLNVTARLTEHDYSFGEVIVREGDPADSFYIFLSGRARVLKKGDDGAELSLNILRAGDEFGEIGLYMGGKRTATVRCSSDVTVLRLGKEDFKALLEGNPALEEYVRLRLRHASLGAFLQEYSEIGKIPLPALKELLGRLKPVTVPKGELIISEGDPGGPMYIIESGKVRIFNRKEGRVRNLAFLRAGDYFGELTALEVAPRSASAEALSECRLLSLAKDDLDELRGEYPELQSVLTERAAQYHAETEARVPLDFSEEILPAEASKADKTIIDDKSEPSFEPFATADGRFRKKKGRIRRFPFVSQIDEMDCGAACLAMICRYFGKAVNISHIRNLAHVSYDGTSLQAITSTASELGLAARAVKVAPEDLDKLPLPAVIHWQGNHWVVLYDVKKRKVRVADPGRGKVTISREELLDSWSGYTALFDYTIDFEKAPEGKRRLAWVMEFVRPYRNVLLEVLLLAVVASGLQLLTPIFTQVIVDKVVVENDLGLLRVMIIAMAVALLFMTAASMLQKYMLSFVAVRIDAAVLDFLTRKMLALPLSYFNTRRTGDIQRRLQGAREIRQFVVRSGVGGILSIIQVAAYLGLMAAYSTTLFLVFLVTAPLYAGLMAFSSRFLRPLFRSLEESYGRYSSHQIDAIKGIEAVKAAAGEQAFRDRMLNEFVSLASKQFRSQFMIMGYEGAVSTVGFLTNLLFLWVGAHMVMKGEMTIGGFVAFNSLVAMAFGPITTVLSLWDDLQVSAVLVDRLNDIFEAEPEQGRDRSALSPVRSLAGGVEFRDVGFQYGGKESPHILRNISFEVPPGTTVAVVGRSGSGKTTLIKCLAGLLEPTEGTIAFDEVDMKTLNYRDLRRQIGIVLQENHIFNGTIMENIAFGSVTANTERALQAARIASAHEFIARLPMNYETVIGEAGLALSGGQKQRIAIARALYNDPPILIFDEATSSLDTESERAIQENMTNLRADRTSFIIAHRLSTVRNADIIVVLEKGKIAEQGTHKELMERRGLYFYLSSQQIGV